MVTFNKEVQTMKAGFRKQFERKMGNAAVCAPVRMVPVWALMDLLAGILGILCLLSLRIMLP